MRDGAGGMRKQKYRKDANFAFLQFPVLALSDAARRVSTILGISVETDVLRFYKMCT